MNDDDAEREFVRELFSQPVPRDVVPPTGLTREDVLRMNDNTGTWTQIHTPGEVVEDTDGNPIGVTPDEVETVYFAGAAMTEHELEQLGLSPEDVPNIRILPDRK